MIKQHMKKVFSYIIILFVFYLFVHTWHSYRYPPRRQVGYSSILPPSPQPSEIFFYISSPPSNGYTSILPLDLVRYSYTSLPCSQMRHTSILPHEQVRYSPTSPPCSQGDILPFFSSTKWDTLLHLLPAVKWDILPFSPRPSEIFFYISSLQSNGLYFHSSST